jgi:hypothetical protein
MELTRSLLTCIAANAVSTSLKTWSRVPWARAAARSISTLVRAISPWLRSKIRSGILNPKPNAFVADGLQPRAQSYFLLLESDS